MKLHKNLLLFGTSAFLLVGCASEESDAVETKVDNVEETQETSTRELMEKAKEESTGEDYESTSGGQEIFQSNELPIFDVKEIMLVYDEYISSDPLHEVAIIRATDVYGELPDYLQGSDHFDSEKLIMVDVHYKNLADPENFYLQLSDFQVYDENGRLLETINQFAGGDPIGQGRSATATFYVEYEEPKDVIEIDYVPYGETLGTFVIPIEHE